ncbi:MAG: hypothetical protein ACNI3A_10045 [Desulfovibrio sp.]|uniref:hypothetical protein n=1 Tax=Desulfovibrio sp. 7SRBS1 TaxID=3378064 RepID=UPI003B413585
MEDLLPIGKRICSAFKPLLQFKFLLKDISKNKKGKYSPAAVAVIESQKNFLCNKENRMEKTASSLVQNIFIGENITREVYFEWLQACSNDYLLDCILAFQGNTQMNKVEKFESNLQSFMEMTGDRKRAYVSFLEACTGYFTILFLLSEKSKFSLMMAQEQKIHNDVQCLREEVSIFINEICGTRDFDNAFLHLKSQDENELENKVRKVFEAHAIKSLKDKCLWNIVNNILDSDSDFVRAYASKIIKENIDYEEDDITEYRKAAYSYFFKLSYIEFRSLLDDMFKAFKEGDDKSFDELKLKSDLFLWKLISNGDNIHIKSQSVFKVEGSDCVLCHHTNKDEIGIVVSVVHGEAPRVDSQGFRIVSPKERNKFINLPETGAFVDNMISEYDVLLKKELTKGNDLWRALDDAYVNETLDMRAITNNFKIFYYLVFDDNREVSTVMTGFATKFHSLRFAVVSEQKDAVKIDNIENIKRDWIILENQ